MSNTIHRRDFLKRAVTTSSVAALGSSCSMISPGTGAEKITGENQDQPNFIIILCDNLGYGDIGCFGSTRHRTPNLDRMAQEGMRLTSFYSASGVCTPSRASLMTGCYPRRVNMHESDKGGSVLRPIAAKGLHPNEITIAEVLKNAGYATACIGKWHLGDQPEFLPNRQGFDYYYGIPYSEDMVPTINSDWPPLPLLRNEQVIEAPVDLNTITRRYTEEASQFIRSNRNKPFFLLLSHANPGSRRYPSVGPEFRGKSANGLYGDSVEEIDWSSKEVLKLLEELGIDENTFVLFVSDNGAVKGHGGSNGPLRGWGYDTSEGAMRVVSIARSPGRIPQGTMCDEICTMMDLLPTFAYLSGTKPAEDRIIDGKNISDLLSGADKTESPYEAFYYYMVDQLQAVRSGKWKLYLPLQGKYRGHGRRQTEDSAAALYDLEDDIGETTDLASKYPEVVERLTGYADEARRDLGDVGREGRNQRPAGWVQELKPLVLNKTK